MLNSMITIQNSELESFHVVRHGSVVIDTVPSQAFSFGEIDMSRFRRKDAAPLCACGCGVYVKWNINYKGWNRFIQGHNSKGENNPMYGKESWSKDKTNIFSEEILKIISNAKKGENNPMYGKVPWNKGKTDVYSEKALRMMSNIKIGKKRSTKTKQKMSIARMGEKNPNYGKRHTIETKQKISQTRIENNHIPWNKGKKLLEFSKRMMGEKILCMGK